MLLIPWKVYDLSFNFDGKVYKGSLSLEKM